MRKKFVLLLSLVPFVLASCHSPQPSSTRDMPSSPDIISIPDGSFEDPKHSSSVDPYQGKEGLDLLYAIFESYEKRNVTVYQFGVSTEYFMEKAYYLEYDNDYLTLYNRMGGKLYNHGFIVNPYQGIYEFTLDDQLVKVSSLESTQTSADWMYENMLNSPADLNVYAKGDDIWQVYDVNNPPKIKRDGDKTSASALKKTRIFKENDSSTTLCADPTDVGEKELDKEAKAIFYSTDSNVKLLAGTLGGLSFDQDNETGEYNTDSIDYVKVRINQDNTLSFNMVYEEDLSAAKFDIQDVGKTKYALIFDFFHASIEQYRGEASSDVPENSYGKKTKTGWTEEENTYFKRNFNGKVLPFPSGASYAFKTYSSATFAAFTDDACGDISESYTKQLTLEGWTLLDESGLEDSKKTESTTTYYKNLNDDGSKQIRISFHFSPSKDPAHDRWNRGTFTANIHRYPYSL